MSVTLTINLDTLSTSGAKAVMAALSVLTQGETVPPAAASSTVLGDPNAREAVVIPATAEVIGNTEKPRRGRPRKNEVAAAQVDPQLSGTPAGTSAQPSTMQESSDCEPGATEEEAIWERSLDAYAELLRKGGCAQNTVDISLQTWGSYSPEAQEKLNEAIEATRRQLEKKTAKTYDATELREALQTFTAERTMAEGIDLLRSYGCVRVSEIANLPAEKQAEFVAKCNG